MNAAARVAELSGRGRCAGSVSWSCTAR